MVEKKKNSSNRPKKVLDRERDRNMREEEFNDRAHGRNEGQWPDWYRNARK